MAKKLLRWALVALSSLIIGAFGLGATAQADVVPADFEVTGGFAPLVSVGTTATFVVTIGSGGAGTTTAVVGNLVVTLTSPVTALQFTGAYSASGGSSAAPPSCVAGAPVGAVMTCTFPGPLPVGSRGTITVQAIAASPGTIPAAQIGCTANDTGTAPLPIYCRNVLLVAVVSGTAAVPAVLGVLPVSGPDVGGTTVTITGLNFFGTTSVNFGAVAAASFVVVSSTTLMATAPPHSAGTVDILLTSSVGTSLPSLADRYTFVSTTDGPLTICNSAQDYPGSPSAVGAIVSFTTPSSGWSGVIPAGQVFPGNCVFVGNFPIGQGLEVDATLPAGIQLNGLGTNPTAVPLSVSYQGQVVKVNATMVVGGFMLSFSVRTPPPPPLVSVTATGPTSVVGTVGRWTFLVRNQSPEPIPTVVLNDSLPLLFDSMSGVGHGWTCVSTPGTVLPGGLPMPNVTSCKWSGSIPLAPGDTLPPLVITARPVSCGTSWGQGYVAGELGQPWWIPYATGVLPVSVPCYQVHLLTSASRAFRAGNTVPVKLQILDAAGVNRSAEDIKLTVVALTNISDGSAVALPSSGDIDSDNDFRFVRSIGQTGGYIYNLNTRHLAAGTYRLVFTVNGVSDLGYAVIVRLNGSEFDYNGAHGPK